MGIIEWTGLIVAIGGFLALAFIDFKLDNYRKSLK